MKNIHILPTEQPSRLHLWTDENGMRLALCELEYSHTRNTQHIYITSSEEIKEGVNQWYLDKFLNKPMNSGGAQYGEKQNIITLTTDQTLIADGVQAIDDEFLEWFVKNPTCEFVEVKSEWKLLGNDYEHNGYATLVYKIIIPQEEPKQETLEEAAERHYVNCIPSDRHSFIAGASWQSKRMYSEEEKELMIKIFHSYWFENNPEHEDNLKEWELSKKLFEQFKKK
jgi:hypothetical protein